MPTVNYEAKTNSELHRIVLTQGKFARKKSTKEELIAIIKNKKKTVSKAKVAPKAQQYSGEY